jgi:hypothetical protein
MYINKSIIVFVFTFFSLFAFGQNEEPVIDSKSGNNLKVGATLKVVDSKYNDLDKHDLFASINPNVTIHFGFDDTNKDASDFKDVYTCTITLSVLLLMTVKVMV